MEELKRIIDDSEVMHEDDALWPPPDRVGRQVYIYHFFKKKMIHFHSYGKILAMDMCIVTFVSD
jgi:hypothetical protein